jgi:hypothetical protein
MTWQAVPTRGSSHPVSKQGSPRPDRNDPEQLPGHKKPAFRKEGTGKVFDA